MTNSNNALSVVEVITDSKQIEGLPCRSVIIEIKASHQYLSSEEWWRDEDGRWWAPNDTTDWDVAEIVDLFNEIDHGYSNWYAWRPGIFPGQSVVR